MNAPALALVLVAAVVHAGWNLAAKRVSGGGARFVFLYYSVSAVLMVPVVAVALAVEPERPQWSWLYAALCTAVLHVAYGLVLQRGYDRGDLSIVYPLARGTGPLVSVLVAVVVLGERPGVLGLVGAFLVVSGVLVISVGGGTRGAKSRRAGVFYGILTGTVIAAYTLWDAHSVTTLGVPPLIYFGGGSLAECALLAPVVLRGGNRAEVGQLWRRYRREVLVVGLASPVAYLLVLYALRIAPVSLVAPARELSIVFGGVAAWLVLRERNAVRRLAGSLVVLAGITAIALA